MYFMTLPPPDRLL